MDHKIIVTDCDGVLLDWQFAFDVWMSEHGYRLRSNSDRLYYQTERYGIVEAEAFSCIKEFNESGAVGFLPAFRDSVYWVAKLADQGWRFDVVSSLHIDKYAQRLRARNLQHIFGDIFREIDASLDFTQGKDAVLKAKYENSHLWWIEDSVSHARSGEKVGMRPIVMDHHYNQSWSGLRASNWQEIYGIINDTTS